jgi:carnitine-CoA ligase
MIESDRLSMSEPPTSLEVLQRYGDHGYTVAGVVRTRAARNGSQPAIVVGDQTITWRELDDITARLAKVYARRGVLRGDRVAVVAANSEIHILTLIALARLGAIMVPINPAFGIEEARYVLDKAGVSGLVCDLQSMEVVRVAAGRCKRPGWLLAIEGDGETLSTLLRSEVDGVDQLGKPDDPCVIIFSSGTSGFPKAVLHSQRTLTLSAEAFVERLRLNADDRVLAILPFFHVNALFYSAAGALVAGARLIIETRFSASNFWDRAVESGATSVNVIEAVGTILARRPRSEYRPEHNIKKVFGVRETFRAAFREDFNIPHLVSGYGMSEIPGTIATPFDRPAPKGTMGKVGRHPNPMQPWTECRVTDESGREVSPMMTGELVVRSPALMLGYFGDDELTRSAFRDGFFRTGDLVKRDADGWYYFVGRSGDTIRRRGENISGAEIDRILETHPSILMAATIAVPSELGEDDILSVIVLKDGKLISAEQVVGWCREQLAPMKVPRYVLFASDLPMTATHKVAKNALRSDKTLVTRAVDISKLEGSS